MRNMIRRVQAGYEPPFNADAEELEIFADCIRQGQLIGTSTYIDRDEIEQESRTMDGKIHPELINQVISPKGLAFLVKGAEDTAADNDQKCNSFLRRPCSTSNLPSKEPGRCSLGSGQS